MEEEEVKGEEGGGGTIKRMKKRRADETTRAESRQIEAVEEVRKRHNWMASKAPQASKGLIVPYENTASNVSGVLSSDLLL